ncbi:MAG: hypothetical protein Q9219_004893 [cf. Caloplaca sp. 3 TL-2023]
MKVAVDNFSVLAVEKCVLSDLANILSPDVIMRLDDPLVSAIAAESESSILERQRCTEKLKILREGLATLNRFNRFRSAGMMSPWNADVQSPAITEDSQSSVASSKAEEDGRKSPIRETEVSEPRLISHGPVEVEDVVEVPSHSPSPKLTESAAFEDDTGFVWGMKSKKTKKNKW